MRRISLIALIAVLLLTACDAPPPTTPLPVSCSNYMGKWRGKISCNDRCGAIHSYFIEVDLSCRPESNDFEGLITITAQGWQADPIPYSLCPIETRDCMWPLKLVTPDYETRVLKDKEGSRDFLRLQFLRNADDDEDVLVFEMDLRLADPKQMQVRCCGMYATHLGKDKTWDRSFFWDSGHVYWKNTKLTKKEGE